MHKAQLLNPVTVGNIATKHPLFLIVSCQHRDGKHNRELFSLHTRCRFFPFPIFTLLILFGKSFGLMCNGMASCLLIFCSVSICSSDLRVTVAAFIDRVLVHTISCSSVCHISSVDIHIYTIKCLYNMSLVTSVCTAMLLTFV